MKRSWFAAVGGVALMLTGALATAALTTGTTASAATTTTAITTTTTTAATAAGDSPPGFWYGSDSWPIPVTGSGPYGNPDVGGYYGGYIGMTGNWAYWLGCKGSFIADSAANNAQAYANYTKYGKGVGVGVYWFMGGPGVDPNYNGSAAEASAWGARQAARALSDIANGHFTYPIVWADIELPGIAPAPDNGWNNVYTSPCSGAVKHSGIPAATDRAVFNGFADYITAHSSYKVGVYSAASVWTDIFGTGSASRSRTPTSGPTSRRPASSAAPRPAGASSPAAAPSSSAGRLARAGTP